VDDSGPGPGCLPSDVTDDKTLWRLRLGISLSVRRW